MWLFAKLIFVEQTFFSLWWISHYLKKIIWLWPNSCFIFLIDYKENNAKGEQNGLRFGLLHHTLWRTFTTCNIHSWSWLDNRIKLVCLVSLLIMQQYGEIAKIVWLEIRIMCPSWESISWIPFRSTWVHPRFLALLGRFQLLTVTFSILLLLWEHVSHNKNENKQIQ
jgi:hypothetical protein